MKIKTVTTIAGVNTVYFDGYTPKYYWIKNLSDATLYVSANPNPVAGADNVSELLAKASTAIETDESVIYILGAGKVEIHNTDSKLCPFELTSTGSGGGGGGSVTVDSYLSDTSTNPVQNKVITETLGTKANVVDIPTSLPANGGNADTVNNHVVNSDVPAGLSSILDNKVNIDLAKKNAKLMTQIAHPNNYLIYDDLDKPSAMVAIPKFYLDEVISGAEHIVHPAFLVNGVEQNAIYISKYQNIVENGRAYSLPMRNPIQRQTRFNEAWVYCKNKGQGWHLMTEAEWGAITLWCRKNGTIPKGNIKDGKDTSETDLPQKAIKAGVWTGTTYVLTGSGRESWYHDGTYAGIADLCGNGWKLIGDIRIDYGELQIIPNAASGECDTSASSVEWRAVKVNATSYDDLFITPDGSGTTANSVKADWVTDHWQWQGTAIVSPSDKSQYCKFANVSCSGLSDFCRRYLQTLLLAPEESATEIYGKSTFYINNGRSDICLIRGGAGMFTGYFNESRTTVNAGVPFYSAYINTSPQPLMMTLESDIMESPEMMDTMDNSETETI